MERPAALSGDSEDSEATLGSEHASLLIQELVAGVVIDEKYRVERVIGRGAMGVVVAAMHVELGEPVALKFMATHGAAPSKGMAARFRREAKVSARLRNEHIARVLDVGAWKHGSLYMVMELLEGAEIGALLKEHGAFPIEVAVAYMAQVCEGLAEAHGRGIVHRDLKPANLFVVQRPGGGPLVKILDFGISKWSEVVIGDDALTETGVLLGTPKYMSPEQLFGAASVDARADVQRDDAARAGAARLRCHRNSRGAHNESYVIKYRT
jgi:serine/threonine-protein kinase